MGDDALKPPSAESKGVGSIHVDLQEKQSVRTTFKLTLGTCDDIAWIAKHYGVTQKEVFEFVCGKILSLESDSFFGLVAKAVGEAEKLEKEHPEKGKGPPINRRKSQVLSRASLKTLNTLAEQHKTSRDKLVDWAVALVKDLLEQSLKKTRDQHENALKILAKCLEEMESAESELVEILEDDDPIRSRFGAAYVILSNLKNDIEEELKDGTPIDPDW